MIAMNDKQTIDNLTVDQAARALGLRPATVRAWIWRRRLAYYKIGGAVRIPMSEIHRILDESLIPAQQEGR
jgi:excisionase family DNA binding protein